MPDSSAAITKDERPLPHEDPRRDARPASASMTGAQVATIVIACALIVAIGGYAIREAVAWWHQPNGHLEGSWTGPRDETPYVPEYQTPRPFDWERDG